MDVDTSMTAMQETEEIFQPAAKKARVESEQQSLPKAFMSKKDMKADRRRAQPPCHLARLPLELLAEVLSYTTSPRDVLALATCSKYFCNTLVDRSSIFIWRRARKSHSVGPDGIPDPTPDWTEPAYASALFESHQCVTCSKITKRSPVSLALRVWVCGNNNCLMTWLKTLSEPPVSIAGDAVCHWLPHYKPSTDVPQTYQGKRLYRAADIQNAIQAFDAAQAQSSQTLEAILIAHEGQARKVAKIMKFEKKIHVWMKRYDAKCTTVKKHNDSITRRFANSQKGWDLWDLYNIATYRDFYHQSNRTFYQIQEADIELIRPALEVEMTALLERRQRSQEEDSLRRRREQVAQHYQRLKSAQPRQVMPPLKDFRRLPVIKALESKSATVKDASKELKEKTVVHNLLNDNLAEWRAQARNDMAALLGEQGWNKGKAPGKLHPVDRITAWFVCTKCEKTSKKYELEGSLDFLGASSHICPGLNKQQRDKYAWSAKQFAPDVKTIEAVKQVLDLSGISAEDADSFERLKTLRLLCLSCQPAAIVMNFQSLIGHAKRHDQTQIKLLSDEEAKTIPVLQEYPLDMGSTTHMRDPSYQSKTRRALKEYGCRHCTQRVQKPTAAVVPDSGSVPSQNDIRRARKYGNSLEGAPRDFNGLRCHLKLKHGADRVGDEDWFKIKEPPPLEAQQSNKRKRDESDSEEADESFKAKKTRQE